MTDPIEATEDLIRAAKAALWADDVLSAMIGARIFDRVPQNERGVWVAPLPLISLGPTYYVSDDADCIDGLEITIQFDVWSRGDNDAFDSIECRRIAGRVRKVLHDAELVLADNALVTMRHQLTRILRLPDGMTYHGPVQFEAVVETP